MRQSQSNTSSTAPPMGAQPDVCCLWGWSSLIIYNSLQAALIYVGGQCTALFRQSSKAAPSCSACGLATGPHPGQQLAPATCHIRLPTPCWAIWYRWGWRPAGCSKRLPVAPDTSSRYPKTTALHHLPAADRHTQTHAAGATF